VKRDLTLAAGDGVPLLLDHYEPAARGSGVTVWIRTPYGRKGIASIAQRFAKTGANVIVEAMRGTDGSGGEFDPFTLGPDDASSVLAWLRTQSWFGGVIATWGLSAIGYASWALTELDVPEWRLAILQDAPSELRDGLIYPGGIFAGKVMLGFVGAIEWQRRHWRASLPRTMLASVRAARRTTKVLSELPLGSGSTTSRTGSPTRVMPSIGSVPINGETLPGCRPACTWRPAGTTSAWPPPSPTTAPYATRANTSA
jgi:uncharacterized protein